MNSNDIKESNGEKKEDNFNEFLEKFNQKSFKLFEKHCKLLQKGFEVILEHIIPFSDRSMWKHLSEDYSIPYSKSSNTTQPDLNPYEEYVSLL